MNHRRKRIQFRAQNGQTMTAAMAALATGSDQVAGNNAAFQSLFFVGLLLFLRLASGLFVFGAELSAVLRDRARTETEAHPAD